MQHSLQATVTSIEGDQLVLSLVDGQEMHIPLSACEGTVKAGSSVRLLVVALGSEDAGRTNLARELVNEILRP